MATCVEANNDATRPLAPVGVDVAALHFALALRPASADELVVDLSPDPTAVDEILQIGRCVGHVATRRLRRAEASESARRREMQAMRNRVTNVTLGLTIVAAGTSMPAIRARCR